MDIYVLWHNDTMNQQTTARLQEAEKARSKNKGTEHN
jgi:hypothetical protein